MTHRIARGRSLGRVVVTALSALVLLPVAAPAAEAPEDAPATRPAAMAVASRSVTDDGTIVARLQNGMTVILHRIDTLPVVSVRGFVRAGSMYEGRWLGCGISHLVEHLVAKGAVHDMGSATAEAAAETTGRVAEIGGMSNASTSLDVTRYYIDATSDKTDECIELVADWMARPHITEADFQREHGVVQRELELGLDDVNRQVWQAHARNVFGTHPAAIPIIGYAKPLSQLTYQDVLDYHARMYIPQNMVFAVVGDIDPEAALKRVTEAFAGFQAGRSVEYVLPEVPPLAGVVRKTGELANLTETVQSLSFQTIPLIHEDLYALDVLSFILTRGEASRLQQALRREKQLVTSIRSFSWTPQWGKGEFTFKFRCKPEAADDAEAALLAELRRVIDDGVSEAELARAKRQKASNYAAGQQSVGAIAGTLASDYLSTGDATFSSNYTRRIQSVTAERVQQMAKKYFDFDRMAITRLNPPAEKAAPTTRPAEAGDDTAAGAKAKVFTLDNGLRVILQPNPSVEMVGLAFAASGGLLAESQATNGIGNVMTSLSLRGAAGRSAKDIAAAFDLAGGGISATSGRNTFVWEARCLDDGLETALEVFADVICRPTFSEAELDLLRPEMIEGLKRREQSLIGQAARMARERFYLNGPYRLDADGSPKAVEGLTAKQIAAHHSEYVRGGSAVLAIFGRFDADSLATAVRKHFADLPAGQARLDLPEKVDFAATATPVLEKTDKAGSAVIAMLPGMTLKNLDDRAAMDVLDTIMSGYYMPSGWLHTELRGKQLVYVVHAYNQPGLIRGAFVTYAGCQPQMAGRVVGIIRKNLARANGYEPTAEEVDLAVKSILTSRLLRNQSMANLAFSAALDELYGLGWDHMRKLNAMYAEVTPADVARVGRTYFDRDPFFLVTTPAPDAFDAPAAADK